ncbi:MAG TPA: hypothetical protein VL966_05605 [Alphaproteobacteria bacterium]|jgi:TPR repeat protein|nr:hypothetical protein [Alphaproteobacteria bacterium]
MTPLLRSPRARWLLGAAVVFAVAAIALMRQEAPRNLPAPAPSPASTQPQATQPPNTRSTFALTSAQIETLTKQATSGSGPAAYRLALYYETVARDYTEAKRWMKASAENGDLGGMYGYAGYLKGSSDPADRATARTWLEKVAARGDDVSKSAARRDLRALDAQK